MTRLFSGCPFLIFQGGVDGRMFSGKAPALAMSRAVCSVRISGVQERRIIVHCALISPVILMITG
jgi:hypothetical protein